MPQLPVTPRGKTQRKLCVIGSAGHTGANCVEWKNVKSVNLVDFDVVIVNVHSLNSMIWVTSRKTSICAISAFSWW